MPLIRGYTGGGPHDTRSNQSRDNLVGTGAGETAVGDATVSKRTGGSMRLGLREAASVALAASIGGLVWLPHVPSSLSAVVMAILVCALIVEFAHGQERLCIGTVDWLIVLFVLLRLLALWNEPEEYGGLDTVVSVVVFLGIFLSMALPPWNERLARRVMATLVLSATAVAAVYWWLSRSFAAVSGWIVTSINLGAIDIGRNGIGQLLGSVTLFAVLFIRMPRRGGARRLAWIAILLFDVTFLIALGSRASLAMVLFGLLANLIIERPKYTYWVVAAFACVAALVPRLLAWISSMGVAAPETLIRGAALVQALMTGDASQIAVASAGRVPIWQEGLASFASSPIWGVGTGGARSMMLQQVGTYSYAHSTLLILLAENGLVGAIVYYAGCLVLAGRLIRWVRRGRDTERQIAATLLAYEFSILVTGIFAETQLNKSAFMLLGLGSALVSRHIRDEHGSDGRGGVTPDTVVSIQRSNTKSRGVGTDPRGAA